MNINKIDPHGATLYSDSRLNVICNGYKTHTAAPTLRPDGTPEWYNLGKLLLNPPPPEWLELQNRIRSTPDEATQKALKSKAFGFTPSAYFGAPQKEKSTGRKVENLKHANALIWLDFDGKGSTGENVNFGDLINVLSKWPCICYIGRSIRGQGYHAGVAVPREDAAEMHAARAAALMIDLKPHFGDHLDEACKDITRLRYYSYTDPKDAYIMHYPENYERFYIAPPAPQPTAKRYTAATAHTGETSQSIIEVFNASNDICTMIEYYRFHGAARDGEGVRYVRHGKQSGKSAWALPAKNIVYIWTSSTALAPNKWYNPFTLFAHMEHGGDYKSAVRALKAAGVQ